MLKQIKKPKNVTSKIFRHQIAMELALRYRSLSNVLDPVLKKKNLSLRKYVMDVYRGEIWCDEVILSVIGLMFNISISMVLPGFKFVRKFCHHAATPDVVPNWQWRLL